MVKRATYKIPERIYRGEYLIAVYDEEDQLVTVCDNAVDFAGYFNRTVDLAHSILSRLYLGKRKSFRFEGKKFHIEFIKEDEE
jgi:hypothetical protein